MEAAFVAKIVEENVNVKLMEVHRGDKKGRRDGGTDMNGGEYNAEGRGKGVVARGSMI